MNTKQILLTLFSFFCIFPAYCQVKKTGSEYKKFYLSLNGGYNYAFGTNNFVSYEDLEIPYNENIFTPGFDGAWFFSKNYGIGIKYRFNKGRHKGESSSEYKEQTYDYPVYKESKISLYETFHFVGTAFFTKWSLGESKWMFLANAGIGYLQNKLSDIDYKVSYYVLPVDFSRPYTLPPNENLKVSGLKGTSIGFSVYAGLHYRITPLIGTGINANGFFAVANPRFEYVNDLT